MANPTEDELTSEQSNLEAAEDQTAESTEQQGDTEAGNAAEDTQVDESEGEAEKPSRGERRHERYIDKLSAEIRASSEIPDRTEELFTPKPYEPLQYKEGDQLEPEDLEKDRKQVGDNRFAEGLNLGYRQGTDKATLQTFETRLDVDQERISQKWEVLDPTKEDLYRPNLEKHLVQQYIAFVGLEKDQNTGRISIQRPNVRFRDFVDAEMHNMEEYAAAKASQSSNNVASQAAKTGLRPSGQSRVSKGGHGFDENDPVGSVANMTKKQYFELGGKEASDAYLAKRGLA